MQTLGISIALTVLGLILFMIFKPQKKEQLVLSPDTPVEIEDKKEAKEQVLVSTTIVENVKPKRVIKRVIKKREISAEPDTKEGGDTI